MDALALFDQVEIGFDSPSTGIVTLLASAKLVAEALRDRYDLYHLGKVRNQVSFFSAHLRSKRGWKTSYSCFYKEKVLTTLAPPASSTTCRMVPSPLTWRKLRRRAGCWTTALSRSWT